MGQRGTRIETPRGGETTGKGGKWTGDTTGETTIVATRRGPIQLQSAMTARLQLQLGVLQLGYKDYFNNKMTSSSVPTAFVVETGGTSTPTSK